MIEKSFIIPSRPDQVRITPPYETGFSLFDARVLTYSLPEDEAHSLEFTVGVLHEEARSVCSFLFDEPLQSDRSTNDLRYWSPCSFNQLCYCVCSFVIQADRDLLLWLCGGFFGDRWHLSSFRAADSLGLAITGRSPVFCCSWSFGLLFKNTAVSCSFAAWLRRLVGVAVESNPRSQVC